MENKWQICELEDTIKSFIELTVSAVPENWTFQREDGTWWCYWPKTNALNKIKTLKQPKPNGNWTTYKCRILMNTAKFPTYEEAVEAEKYCQNYSTLMDCSDDGDLQTENICNSTMDFEVSCFTDDYDTSEGETNDVGHDTFEFNKAIAKGGPFYSKNPVIHTDDHLNFYCNDETLKENDTNDSDFSEPDYNSQVNKSEKNVADELNTISETLDYSTQFKNVNGISSSTLLEVDDVRKIDELRKDDSVAFISKISKIEANVSTFFNTMQEDIRELKEISKSFLQNPTTEPSSSQAEGLDLVNRELILNDDLYTNHVNEQSKLNAESNGSVSDQIAQGVIENVDNANAPLQREITNEKSDTDVMISDCAVQNKAVVKMVEIVNAPFKRKIITEKTETEVAMSNASESVQMAQKFTENVEITYAPLNHEITIEKSKTDVANCKPVMNLPVTLTPSPSRPLAHYEENENMLDEMEVETALIEHLSPLKDEDETNYIERIIGLLFTDDFFIQKVTFKPEKDRAFMKTSNLFYCWKESHGKTFPEDIDNQRFIKHFRRIKSAKRAALKAKAKKELNGSQKPKSGKELRRK